MFRTSRGGKKSQGPSPEPEPEVDRESFGRCREMMKPVQKKIIEFVKDPAQSTKDQVRVLEIFLV